MKVTLGHTYRDKTSNFKGVAVARMDRYKGTTQIQLQKVHTDEEDYKDPLWFEVGRLEAITGTTTSSTTTVEATIAII